jgi:hypothetical protein
VPEVPDLRHGVGDAEAAGTLALREVRGAEDPVDDRQAEVLVPRLGIDCVVPVVPFGGVDDPPDSGEPKADVGVLEIARTVTNTATPAKVPPPYPRITSGITVNACVNAWSKGWSRPAVAQSIASMLWWTAWKRHRNGTVCVRR